MCWGNRLGEGGIPRTVNAQLAVPNNLLDQTLLLKIRQRLASQRSVNLETINQRGDSDEAVGLHVLGQLVGGSLVKDDSVVCLVLDCRKVSSAILLCIVGGVFNDRIWDCSVSRCSRGFRFEGLCTVYRAPGIGNVDHENVNIPFPLDHFFFCFFPPVAAGACKNPKSVTCSSRFIAIISLCRPSPLRLSPSSLSSK